VPYRSPSNNAPGAIYFSPANSLLSNHLGALIPWLARGPKADTREYMRMVNSVRVGAGGC